MIRRRMSYDSPQRLVVGLPSRREGLHADLAAHKEEAEDVHDDGGEAEEDLEVHVASITADG